MAIHPLLEQRVGQARMSRGKLGIEPDGFFEQGSGRNEGLQGKLMDMPYAALIALPRTQAFGRPATGDDLFGVVDFGNDGGRYGCCDLILDSKDITQLAVVALGPEMIALLSIDELDSDPPGQPRISVQLPLHPEPVPLQQLSDFELEAG